MAFKTLILLMFIQLFIAKDLLHPKQFTSQYLKKTCLNQSHKNLHYSSEVKSLVCGQSLSSKKNKDLLINSGIIHMFVVSGAHLSFYRKVMSFFLPKPILPTLQILFLVLYTFTCQFSAPILRATTEEFLKKINKNVKLNWLKEQSLLITGIICLILRPSLFDSLSLPLSWVAAICLCQKSNLTKVFTLFIVLYPILLSFYLPNPLSLIIGFFLTSLVSFVFLPINLLSFCFPFLNSLLKNFYDLFYFILNTINDHLPSYEPTQSLPINKFWIWVYVLSINLLIIFYKKRKHRQQ